MGWEERVWKIGLDWLKYIIFTGKIQGRIPLNNEQTLKQWRSYNRYFLKEGNADLKSHWLNACDKEFGTPFNSDLPGN
jgi:hypothetical protein